ncbi:hypothetical protein L3V82_10835 [Thiotrichales bacterium 19S3-7]|nr:hypothetical protein [Thiotrichales bacterium 19S3-7]MCF6802653.1 hypothetical protein [Thiotrichales bacterium 19S3-11]
MPIPVIKAKTSDGVRDFCVVDEQAYYRSSGSNSGTPGLWYPCEGVGEGSDGAVVKTGEELYSSDTPHEFVTRALSRGDIDTASNFLRYMIITSEPNDIGSVSEDHSIGNMVRTGGLVHAEVAYQLCAIDGNENDKYWQYGYAEYLKKHFNLDHMQQYQKELTSFSEPEIVDWENINSCLGEMGAVLKQRQPISFEYKKPESSDSEDFTSRRRRRFHVSSSDEYSKAYAKFFNEKFEEAFMEQSIDIVSEAKNFQRSSVALKLTGDYQQHHRRKLSSVDLESIASNTQMSLDQKVDQIKEKSTVIKSNPNSLFLSEEENSKPDSKKCCSIM